MRAIYNKLADTYDFRSNNPTTLLVRKKENKLIEKFAEGRVLDFGCGTGYHLSLFFPKKSLQAIQKKGITDMIGLDISFCKDCMPIKNAHSFIKYTFLIETFKTG